MRACRGVDVFVDWCIANSRFSWLAVDFTVRAKDGSGSRVHWLLYLSSKKVSRADVVGSPNHWSKRWKAIMFNRTRSSLTTPKAAIEAILPAKRRFSSTPHKQTNKQPSSVFFGGRGVGRWRRELVEGRQKVVDVVGEHLLTSHVSE